MALDTLPIDEDSQYPPRMSEGIGDSMTDPQEGSSLDEPLDLFQDEQQDNPESASEPENKELDKEEYHNAVLACFDFYRREDEETRNNMMMFWAKLESYWEGITDIFWDFGANDWRQTVNEGQENNPESYDKILNIYRAYGESIIAALSIKLPTVTFYPDDADVIEDVETAKGYTKIWDLIVKHNKGKLLFMKALYILFNNGVVAAYIYNRESVENGVIRVPEYGDDVTLNHHTAVCPLCGAAMGQETTKDNQIHSIPDFNVCPSCEAAVEPDMQVEQEKIPQVTGYTELPKSKTHIEVFGPKYAQFPFYARKQSDIPFFL